ncbi:hypothetical protein GCM10020000_05810 [Streptomyces olivoverticillatus]
MGEFVDQRHLRAAREDGGEVELGAFGAMLGVPGPGQDLQAVEQLLGVRAAVALDKADHDVGAAQGPAPSFVQHAVGLADAGGAAPR